MKRPWNWEAFWRGFQRGIEQVSLIALPLFVAFYAAWWVLQ